MSKTVLLVDDSRVARMMARRVIESAHPDWAIVEAGAGEEALLRATETPPDFVVLDVNMPGIDGMETARRMIPLCPAAKITLLTANIQEPIRVQAEQMGIAFMNKPLREDALLAFLAAGVAP